MSDNMKEQEKAQVEWELTTIPTEMLEAELEKRFNVRYIESVGLTAKDTPEGTKFYDGDEQVDGSEVYKRATGGW